MPNKNDTDGTIPKNTTETIETQASRLLEELSKSGILGMGVDKKRLTIEELTPKDANADLKKRLEGKSRLLEERTRESLEELVRQGFAGNLEGKQ